MSCPVCGTALVPGARFCWNCGTPAEGSAVEDAERRVVTVLFGDLSDFTSWAEDLDPERVGVVTDRVLAALADTVTEVGGHVDKLTGDGIMAVFGAPTSHEDDAERAVRAAAAMQAAVSRLATDEGGGGRRLGLRVGLNTGEVLAGVQGQRSYTVVGDAVNTASRLSDSAGVGAVFAGRQTAVATMPVASWRPLPPLRLKGKRDPVEAYELVSLRAGTPSRFDAGIDAPMIGREAELGALMGRFLTVAERRKPASALVIGEAGIGKTRLVGELARFAGEIPGTRVLWGHCVPYGLGRDLAPLTEIVRTACGVAEGDGPEVAGERVRRAVSRLQHPAVDGRFPPSLADRLLGLLGQAPDGPVPDPTLRDGATPGRRPERPDLDALVALVNALAAGGPLLIVIDDLHYARPALRDALLDIAARITGPVLLVGAGRPEMFEPDGVGSYAGLPEPELIPVQSLDGAAAERLLRAYLGGTELEPPAREALLARAEGNPFFLAEMLHLLVDRGVLRPAEGGGWDLVGEPPGDVLPAGVQAVLAARMDSLEPASRGLLRDAAVLGTSFPASALVALDGRLDRDQVTSRLDGLVARGILTAQGDGRYTFTHTLARDVAYAGLPKADRARRHATAACWAAEHLRAPASEVDAVVSVQADRAARLAQEMALPADDPAWSAAGMGLAAAARLGEEALARDDHRSAEEHLVRALRLADAARAPAARRLPSQVAYAEALAGQRRLDEAAAQLRAPLEATDPQVRARALVILGDLRHKQQDHDGARSAFVQAFALAGDSGLDVLTGAAIRQLGMLDYLGGQLCAAEQRFGQALDLARRVGDSRGAGWALQHLAWSATTRGDYPAADTAVGEARAVFLELQDSGGLAWCAGTEALVRLLQGSLGEARALVAGLLPLATALGASWETAACLTIDAIAAAELGEFAVAEREATDACSAFAVLGDTWGRSMAQVAVGFVARGRGRTRDARNAFRRAASTAAEGGHRVQQVLASVALGLLHLDRGDIKAAAAAADHAEKMAAPLDLLDGALVGLRVLRAQVLRARGELDRAAALLEQAGSGQVPSLLFPRRQALAHLAGVRLEQGDAEEAMALVLRAVSTPAEDVRSRVVTQRVLAQVLLARGDRDGAAAATSEALRLIESTGLTGELAGMRKLAGRTGGHAAS